MNTKYLIAIADTHGHNAPLGKISRQIRILLEKYHKPLEDCALLYLGDTLPLEKVQETDVDRHCKEFADALANADLPVIGVGGNHDVEDSLRAAFDEKGWHYLH